MERHHEAPSVPELSEMGTSLGTHLNSSRAPRKMHPQFHTVSELSVVKCAVTVARKSVQKSSVFTPCLETFCRKGSSPQMEVGRMLSQQQNQCDELAMGF